MIIIINVPAAIDEVIGYTDCHRQTGTQHRPVLSSSQQKPTIYSTENEKPLSVGYYTQRTIQNTSTDTAAGTPVCSNVTVACIGLAYSPMCV